MKRRIYTIYYFIRFMLEKLLGRSHMQETILLRRSAPTAGAPAAGQGPGPTMILKIRLNGQSRMIVLPIR